MTTVRQILQRKSPGVWTVGPQATAYEALALMAQMNIGAVLVLEEDALVGIFSERDYARKVILMGRSSRDTAVRELMSHPVVSVNPDIPIEACMALMTERHFRHLPVVEEGRLIGIISIGDIGKAIIADQRIAIHDLERYITGAPS
jgi:CBS domain-containing protein